MTVGQRLQNKNHTEVITRAETPLIPVDDAQLLNDLISELELEDNPKKFKKLIKEFSIEHPHLVDRIRGNVEIMNSIPPVPERKESKTMRQQMVPARDDVRMVATSNATTLGLDKPKPVEVRDTITPPRW